MEKFNQLLDRLSDYLALRKGLLPMMGIALVIMNWVLQFIPSLGGFAGTNSLLHLGVILSIIGILLAWIL